MERSPTGGFPFCGDAWEQGYGAFEWRSFVPERVMPWYVLANNGAVTAGYGVKTRPDAFCSFNCDPNGITLIMDVQCGGADVVLRGRSVHATVVCREYTLISAYESACLFVKELVEGAVLPDTPVYGFNNWYYAYGNSSHEDILENTAHVARLTRGNAVRPYMVIDDGWQINRTADYIGGPWRTGNDRFPNMEGLATQMKEMDVRPGIWFRPLQNTDPAIPKTWRRSDKFDLLDPSVPEVLAYIQEDVRTLTEWGYELIKYDFSTFDLVDRWGADMYDHLSDHTGIAFADTTKTTAMIIKELYDAIYEAADGKALILGCNCVGHLGVGAMEINRTGDDVSGFVWERTRQRGINTLAFRMPQHNALFAVDADCVGITDQIDWQKNRQWLTLLAHSGTPLFVSVAPTTLNKEQTRYLAEMLRVAATPRPTARPLDWMNTTTPAKWDLDGAITAFDWYEAAGIPKAHLTE